MILLKAILNSIFGKLLSSTDKFSDFKINSDRIETLKLLASDLLKDYMVLKENLVLFQMNRRTTYYGYNTIMAACVLSFAKLNLYRKHDEIMSKFKAKLMYYDTDSLVYHIEDRDKSYPNTLNVNRRKFDFSNLESNHFLYSNSNKGKPGIYRFIHPKIKSMVCLRPKVYSFDHKCTCGYFREKCVFCKSGRS
jgi:hypothetical protein